MYTRDIARKLTKCKLRHCSDNKEIIVSAACAGVFFRQAPKHVQVRLEKKWLAGLISTPEFIDRNGGSTISVKKREGAQSATPSRSSAVGEPKSATHLV